MERGSVDITRETAQLIQLRDSGGIAYLSEVVPAVTPLVEALSFNLTIDHQKTHAAFWLIYLRSYNAYASQARQVIDSDGDLQPERHISAVKEWLGEVKERIAISLEDGFFNNPEVQDLLEGLILVELTDIEDQGPLLLEIPGRIKKIAERAAV